MVDLFFRTFHRLRDSVITISHLTIGICIQFLQMTTISFYIVVIDLRMAIHLGKIIDHYIVTIVLGLFAVHGVLFIAQTLLFLVKDKI